MNDKNKSSFAIIFSGRNFIASVMLTLSAPFYEKILAILRWNEDQWVRSKLSVERLNIL